MSPVPRQQGKSRKPVRKPVKVRVPQLSAVRPPAADLDVANIKLTGKDLTAKLRNAITDASLEQTIQGASTLTITVSDWHEGLLHSQLVKEACTLTFDGLSFTLTKLSRQGYTTALTFEETAVALLRKYRSPRKATRSSTTRAQFIHSMVTEVKEAVIPFVCPELNIVQPIAASSSSVARRLY